MYKLIQSTDSFASMQQMNDHGHHLKQLFEKRNLNHWLEGVIDFWSQNEGKQHEFLFHDWSAEQQQLVLNFFSEVKFIDLVNAIFFYKLHPNKLFTQKMHPEKLISIRSRLSVLHYYIELMQQQLYSASLQNGLMPGVDHLLHGDALPQGIMLEVDENYKEMIQEAIKKLKMASVPQNAQHEALTLLHDLGKAYKFWFNPNRLIDMVMTLQQILLPETAAKDFFQQELSSLFCQFKTTDCLDLYGYFANNDSRYLLHTFFVIAQEKTFDWLPILQEEDKNTLKDVFHALSAVMEALRIELKKRRVHTEPYGYNRVKQDIQIGHRNRDAVFRAISLYRRKTSTPSEHIKQCFQFIEDSYGC